jgi:hypothetical protein
MLHEMVYGSAKAHDGRLTAARLAAERRLSLDEAHDVLELFELTGACEGTLRDDGEIEYVFRGLRD